MAAPEVKNVNKNIDRDFDLFRITHGKKLNQEGHNLILSGEFFVRKDEKLLKRFESNPIGNLVHVRDLLGPAFHGFCIDADPPFAAETGLHNPDPDVWVWLHTQNEKSRGPKGFQNLLRSGAMRTWTTPTNMSCSRSSSLTMTASPVQPAGCGNSRRASDSCTTNVVAVSAERRHGRGGTRRLTSKPPSRPSQGEQKVVTVQRARARPPFQRGVWLYCCQKTAK